MTLKVAEEEETKLKAAEEKVTRLKAEEEKAAKVKPASKRPQSPYKLEEDPIKKKQRMEAARSYLKSIVSGSVARGTPICS